jgi:hypothetical protein
MTRGRLRSLAASIALAGLLGSAIASGAPAATVVGTPFKIAEVIEYDQQGGEVQHRIAFGEPEASSFRSIDLGDPPHRNNLGDPTFARAYVDDGGSFWEEVSSDSPSVVDGRGQGWAETSLYYTMRKDSEDAVVTLEITGGELFIADFGYGIGDLYAATVLSAYVVYGGQEYSGFSGHAAVAGHGGRIGSTTNYRWEGTGFVVDESNFTLITSGVIAIGASLGLRDQTLVFSLDGICLTCTFQFSVRSTTSAVNVLGEATAAHAYFRDPLHFGDLGDPGAGGVRIAYQGVTVLPVPEPPTAACLGGGLVAVAVTQRRRPGRRSLG